MGIENPKIGLGFPSRELVSSVRVALKLFKRMPTRILRSIKKSTRVGWGGSDTGYLVVCKYTHTGATLQTSVITVFKTFLPTGGHVRLEG